MRKRKPWKFIFILLFAVAISLGIYVYQQQYEPADLFVKVGEGILDNAPEIFSGEPKEVRELRTQEVADTDTQRLRQEYYFGQLNEEEQRGYREMIEGIRSREKEFYLTIYDDDTVNKVYHAVLMDHPELFWVHNRKQVYKTTFSNANYCMFSPGYSYTDEEIREIQAAADNACQEVSALVSEGADDYEKAKAVYTYLIDTAEYQESEDDQSMAGIFWRKQAVCAGYAGAAQYLLEYENMDAKTFELVFTGEEPLPPPADSPSSGVDAGPDLLPEVTGAKPRKSAEVPAPQSDASEESDGEE